jgi:hypothetical protein
MFARPRHLSATVGVASGPILLEFSSRVARPHYEGRQAQPERHRHQHPVEEYCGRGELGRVPGQPIYKFLRFSLFAELVSITM